MIGSLSPFSPGSLQSYGSSSATPQSLASDGSAVCTSLDCGEHGAANRAKLQAQFPGLTVLGGEATQTAQQAGTATRRPVNGAAGAAAPNSGKGLASGATLLGAQQAEGGNDSAKGADDLNEEERAAVAKLKQIDAKVRAHERAHAAAGGQHAGAPSYSYTRGPDGQMYATGGEVAIDIGPENDPEATLQKAAQVAAAALAPADPSGQDRAVAAAAAQLRLQALAQIREEKRAETEQKDAERAEDKAADAERQQALGGGGEDAAPSASAVLSLGSSSPDPASAQPGSDGLARRATAAYQRQGEAPPQATSQAGREASAGADGNPAQARIATANRRIGQLIGLIA